MGATRQAVAAPGDAPAKPARNAPVALAENAIVQMAQGEYREAARQTQAALQIAPDDPMLLSLAGAILLNTGDAKGALTAFQSATACAQDDSLARYGLGLAQLAKGDRKAALASFQRAEKDNGDKAYLFLARRYTQWLDGAQIAVRGAALPDEFTATLRALQGMSEARQGDLRNAVTTLEAALAAIPGDALLEPGGLLMDFEVTRSIETATPIAPGKLALDTRLPKEQALGGDISLSPENLTASVSYVSFELDGQALGLVNTPPFRYTWDSHRVANGYHQLTILLYDSNGREISQASRRIRIFNAGGPTLVTGSEARLEPLRAALWQALSLRPDRGVCAYVLGKAYRALGNPAMARLWFARAAAVLPNYRDTRQQLAALGGLGTGGVAVWGGLRTEKIVALTFDDGPKPGITEPLLDILTQNRIPATFFVVGHQAMLYPDLTRKIAAAGMEIANHSYTHPNLTLLPAEEVAREILQTQAIVQMLTGKTPRFLRPPGGNWSGEVAQTARYWGLTPCFWTVDAYGAEVLGAQQVADAVLAQVRPGSIVLMHNGKMSTIQALPTILRVLRERGYSFATVDTLARRLAASKEAAQEAARWNEMQTRRRAE